jgi:hypothetical protein
MHALCLQDQLIAELAARLELLEASNRDLLQAKSDFDDYRERNDRVVGE